MNPRPYEWMVKFTPQREWIDGWGVWLWFAFVLGGLGAGTYIVSLYFGNPLGALAGWFIVVVLKGGTHLIYLGKPWRFWRAFFRPQTSWISRGLIFVFGFAIFGALQIAPQFLASLPWGSESAVLRALAVVFALLVMVYPGFTMNFVNAIPLWNNALLPVLFLTYGFLGGFGLSLPFGLIGGLPEQALHSLENGLRLLLVAAAVLLAVYLTSVRYTSPAGKQSVLEILRGRVSPIFYLGVLTLGVAVPFAISVGSYASGGLPNAVLVGAGLACELVGSFSLRYCLLKAGKYAPLVPRSSSASFAAE